jgi:hypothetical protein
MIVKGVFGQAHLRTEQLELRRRHEPQQIAFAAAMRAIALKDLLKVALDFEIDLPAMATTFETHARHL